MPILILKEFLKFYRDHGSTMFVCFLGASKAFDRVDYTIYGFVNLSIARFQQISCDCPGTGIASTLPEFIGQVLFQNLLLFITVLDRMVFYHPSYLQCILTNFRCAYSQKTLDVD